MLKNGATPNFVEFKDENENVVASISTSGDLNVAGSITVNGSEVGATGPAGTDGGWSTSQTLYSITGSTDTPKSADNGKLITINTTSGAVTITIDGSLDLPTGGRIDFAWIGAATSVTFSASGATVNGTPGLKLRARYSAATLVCIDTDTYLLVGDLSA